VPPNQGCAANPDLADLDALNPGSSQKVAKIKYRIFVEYDVNNGEIT
jgi:hypothetical protein